MREEEFRNYLTQNTTLQSRPLGDCVSRCKRIEKYLGNLDDWYHRDFLRKIFNNLHDTSTSIPINGNIKAGMNSLRSALKHYQNFCKYSSDYNLK